MVELARLPISCISAFDLDETLIKGNCTVLFFSFLYKNGVLPSRIVWAAFRQAFSRYILKRPVLEMHYCAVKLLSQFSARVILYWADKFLEDFSNNLLYEPTIQRLKDAQQQGHLTVLLSNSPNFLVERFAQYFGMHQSYSSEYIKDGFGRFSRISYVVSGERKAIFLNNLKQQLQIDSEDTFAYTDSLVDLPFLEQAGHAFVVNPKRKLWQIAKHKNWEVI